MKKIGTELKKYDVTLSKGYMKWYRVVEDEIRLFINESHLDNGKRVNKIDWRTSDAKLCIGCLDYAEKFYEKHKDYKVRFFVKSDVAAVYSEYAVKNWLVYENGLRVELE